MGHVYSRERREQHDPDGDRLTKSVAAQKGEFTVFDVSKESHR